MEEQLHLKSTSNYPDLYEFYETRQTIETINTVVQEIQVTETIISHPAPNLVAPAQSLYKQHFVGEETIFIDEVETLAQEIIKINDMVNPPKSVSISSPQTNPTVARGVVSLIDLATEVMHLHAASQPHQINVEIKPTKQKVFLFQHIFLIF